jgi:flap endonuclease-1
MGIALRELIIGKEIEIKELSNKVICIDGPMLLYQFMTSIRQSDGSCFTDKEGKITSHLIGLNSRLTKLIQYGLKLVVVFDGKSPELKKKEQERRKEIKRAAEEKYRIAMEKKDFAEMKKYATRSVHLTKEIIEESKEFISAFGIPVFFAPSEAEAQCSHMVKKGDAFAVATQDADALIFGSIKIVKNLSLIGKHKRANKLDYQTYKPEIITLSDVLNNAKIDFEQLIYASILVGTDFNPGGVKGIGPKNSIKIVKENTTKEKIKKVLADRIDFDFDEIYTTIKTIPVTDDYVLKWEQIDEEKIYEILVKRHNFSEERVKKNLESLKEYSNTKKQSSLDAFF